MKTLLIALASFLLTATLPAWAQSPYEQAMTDALTLVKQQNRQTTVPDMLAVAGRFERIASAEPQQWLPRYYAGLMYVYCGFAGKDAAEKDRFLDKADQFAQQAEAMSPNNDELAVLRAYIAQARMTVDPANRWQTYGGPFQTLLEKAKKLNPANPRPDILEANSLFYTPEQFGGGLKTACPVIRRAGAKFTTFQPASALHPNWGQGEVKMMLTECDKATAQK